MRASGRTAVASMVSNAAPESARWPRWMRCQSVMQPLTAEYWHIGAMTIRLANSRAPTRSGVNNALMPTSPYSLWNRLVGVGRVALFFRHRVQSYICPTERFLQYLARSVSSCVPTVLSTLTNFSALDSEPSACPLQHDWRKSESRVPRFKSTLPLERENRAMKRHFSAILAVEVSWRAGSP